MPTTLDVLKHKKKVQTHHNCRSKPLKSPNKEQKNQKNVRCYYGGDWRKGGKGGRAIWSFVVVLPEMPLSEFWGMNAAKRWCVCDLILSYQGVVSTVLRMLRLDRAATYGMQIR